MSATFRASLQLILCLAFFAGCETLAGGAFQQEPLSAGSDWERIRLVWNSPSSIGRDPAVTRLTSLVKQDPEGNLKGLVDALAAGRPDDFERVRAIHDWITRNISYDFPAFRGQAPKIVEPYAVIRHGASICYGYAHLFTRMCTIAGIQSEVVSGYGRGYGFDPYTEDDQPYQANHAWNAVLINGGWYLVDTTWDAGGVDGAGSADSGFTFKWQYSTGFLFTPPDVFLCSHFPDDPRWQLKDQPLDLAQLRSLPALWGDFGTLGFSSSSTLQRVANVGEEQEVLLRAPPRLRVTAFILPDSAAGAGHTDLVGTKQVGDEVTLRVHFPKPGRYGVWLGAYREGDTRNPSTLGMLFFNAKGGSLKRTALLYPGARESGLSMDAESGYVTQVGATTTFSFTYGEDVLVYLRGSEGTDYPNRIRVARSGSQQVATVSFPRPGEYTVGLAARDKKDANRWTGIASLTFFSQAGSDLEFPVLTAKAREVGLTLDLEQGYDPNVRGETQIALRVQAPVTAHLVDGANKPVEGGTFVASDGDVKTVRVSFPGPGSYTVWISAAARGQAGAYSGIASLHYIARGGGRGFPTVYADKDNRGFQIVAPLEGKLTAGQDARFEVTGPAAGQVYVQVGKTRVSLRGDAGHFTGTVPLTAGKLYVFGAVKPNVWSAIAGYEVK